MADPWFGRSGTLGKQKFGGGGIRSKISQGWWGGGGVEVVGAEIALMRTTPSAYWRIRAECVVLDTQRAGQMGY